MLINLHRFLILFYLNLSLLDGRSDLPSEHHALISAVRCRVVPLAIFLVIQLFSRWDIMIWGKAGFASPLARNRIFDRL
jgi:hypothetical protein